MDSSTLINQLNEELDTLRQRLGEAERLFDQYMTILLHNGDLTAIAMDVQNFLEQKGGDVGSITHWQSAAERDYLRRQLTEMQSRNQSTFEELMSKLKLQEERAERAEAEVKTKNLQLIDISKKNTELEAELAMLKSVRTLTGVDLWKIKESIGDDVGTLSAFWDDFATRLQARCTCEPMTVEQLRIFLYGDAPVFAWVLEKLESLVAHIWPKVEPKPTREELLGQVVETFRNDVMTVYMRKARTICVSGSEHEDRDVRFIPLDGMTRIFPPYHRDEAELAAKEMLIEQALKGNP